MSNDTPAGPPDREPDERPDEQPDGQPKSGPEQVPDAAADGSPTDQPTDQPAASDGTPTERFGAADDPDDGVADAATKILPATPGITPNPYVPAAAEPYPAAPTAATTPLPPTTPPAGPPAPPTPPKKKHTLLYWLIGIGAVLLIAVIVLLVMLFSPGDDAPEPTASPTPSATPSEEPSPSAEPSQEPTPTPTQAPASPTFATFSAPTNADCQEGDDEAPLSFSWSSDDAVRAYLGVGTQNAAINPTVSDLPPTATYTDLAYDCSVASQVYTVTLEDEAGALASRTVTITR